MKADVVSVTGCPHPFRPGDRVHDVVPVGGTLESIVVRGLDAMGVPEALRGCGHAFVDGEYVPRDKWADVTPRAGSTVTYRLVPAGGGGGSKALRGLLTVAVIALAVVSQQYYLATYGTTFTTAAGVTAYTAGSMAASAAVAAAVTGAGMLAINSLVPLRPASLSQGTASSAADSPTYSIEGVRNTLRPWGTVPLLLGRHRIVPPQCAMPYTEVVGNDQYVRQLFCLGYAEMQIETGFRLGETDINAYSDVQLEVLPFADKTSRPAHYSNDVYEQSLSVQLKQSGGWQTRTTPQACDRIDIDISLPRGLVQFNDRAQKMERTVLIEAQYAPKGSQAWASLGGPLQVGATSYQFERARQQVKVGEYVDGNIYDIMEWRDVPQWHVICSSASGRIEQRAGAIGVDSPQPTPAGYTGIVQVRVVGAVVSRVVIIAPAGSDAITYTTGTANNRAQLSLSPLSLPITSLEMTAAQTSALRRTVGVDVPTGQYDVRVRRITADTDDSKIADETWWGALRSTRKIAPLRFSRPLCVVSTRIRATGQLNGALDELNCIAQTVCLDWDKATRTWVRRPTSNPASLFRYVLQGPAIARPVPDDRLDLDQLAYWHEFCERRRLTYNRVHDYTASVEEVLDDVAAAGLAGRARPNGKWSVVIDEPRTRVAQHFSPRTSWGFRSTKALPQQPHAWRVRFVNATQDWKQDERIVYADGYDADNATVFEGLELPGVTDPEQVWVLGRHHIACARLRPEEYELYADMEHLVCTRGDLVVVQHDVPMWGVASGRVKSVAGQVLTVDEPVGMEAGQVYRIRWRSADGASHVRDVVTVAGHSQTLQLSGTGDVPEAGDLWLFGLLGRECAQLVVKGIEPGENLTARLVLVDYAPAVFDAATGPIPPFDSNITLQGDDPAKPPHPPSVLSLRSDEAVLVRQASGALVPRIAVDYRASGGASVQVRVRPAGGSWRLAGSAAVEDGVVYADGVEESVEYEVCVQTITRLGVGSGWTAPQRHTVVGRTTPPPAPSGVYLEGAHVYWTMPDDAPVDVAGWEVLMGMDDTDPVERALLLTPGLLTERRFDVGPWAGRARRVFVRTVDDIGLRSPAVSAVVNLGDEPVQNVVLTISEAAQGGPGTLTGGIRLDGKVHAAGARAMWGGGAMWPPTTMWGDAYLPASYVARLLVPDEATGARLRVAVQLVTGVLDAVEYAHGPRRPAWDGSPMWGAAAMWGGVIPTAWNPMPDLLDVATGDEVYIRVTSRGGTQGVLADVQWTFDVPDADLTLDGVAVPSSGMRLPVPAGLFRWIRAITFGLEFDGGTAASCRYLDKGVIEAGRVVSGPLVQCIDSNGAPVAGRIDARLQGAAGG